MPTSIHRMGMCTLSLQCFLSIKKLNLQKHVILTNFKPHDELVLWYNAADIFCLSSSIEGCPNVVLESLACGTPVISTKVGGIPEIIINDRFGFIVNGKNGLEKSLKKGLKKSWNNSEIAAYGSRNTWESISDFVISDFRKIV